MKTSFRLLFSLLLLSLCCPATGYSKPTRKEILEAQISSIIKETQGFVGIGIMGLDFRDSIVISSRDSFPMQSVYKFPLAIAILQLADKGRLSLTQRIHIRRQDLDTATWSPMLKKFKGESIDLSIKELLDYSVSQSDNNACDVLFRIAGGPRKVNSYIHSLGIKGMQLNTTEAGMKKGPEVQYSNWCRPEAMLQLLRDFYAGKLLSPANTALLMQQMTQSSNSPKRIKGLLPPAAVVAHKTGTSGTNEQGFTAATNDIGIITLPNGKHIALVVYVSDYTGCVEKGENTIARIAKLVWDYYNQK